MTILFFACEIDEIEGARSLDKDYGATRVKALYTNSDEGARGLEVYLIEKCDPQNNLI